MKSRLYFLVAISLCTLAICLSLFLPTRIAEHDDIDNTSFTHKSYVSLFSYFTLSRPISDDSTQRIGVTPYTQYYVQTYAGEVWLLAALFLVLAAKSFRNKNTKVYKIAS